MGGSESIENNEKTQLIERSYAQYGGKVSVDMKNKIVYQMLEVTNDQNESFKYFLSKRMRLKHANLISVKEVEQINKQSNTGICSTQDYYQYRVGYDLEAYTLENQIQRHCKIEKPFLEKEICFIFEKVVSCLDYLHQNGTIHGDIKAKNIFLGKNTVKLIDSYFVQRGKTAYELVVDNQNSLSLLSPQQLEKFRNKLFDSLINIQFAEIFSLGLVMIEVIVFRKAMECYDLKENTIKDEYFVNKMNEIIGYGFSYQLANLILDCVHKNQYKRPTFKSFLSRIRLIQINALNKELNPSRSH